MVNPTEISLSSVIKRYLKVRMLRFRHGSDAVRVTSYENTRLRDSGGSNMGGGGASATKGAELRIGGRAHQRVYKSTPLDVLVES